jgi:hypothetical protein
MIQRDLIETLGKATRQQTRLNTALLKEAQKRAEIEKRRNEIRRRTEIQEKWFARNLRVKRMHQTLYTINQLCVLGSSQEFQKLLQVRGQPLIVWGGEKSITAGFDMADIWWKWVSRIVLTNDELQFEVHTETSGDFGIKFRKDFVDFALHLPYDQFEMYSKTRPLWKIATAELPHWANQKDINFEYSTERLFEALVQASKPAEFAKLIRSAM